MKIYCLDPCKEDILIDSSCAACIGYFDGFHLGHRQLVNETVKYAKEHSLQSAVITFDPDPWVVLKGLENVVHIMSISQRQQIAEELGIDCWYQIKFSKELAGYEPDVFIKKVIEPLGVKHLVCGFDFTYGAFGKGKANDLLSYTTFTTQIISPITYLDEKISSTRIENYIRSGEMDIVEEILGKPFTMESMVVHGHKIGHTIGFPTINLDVENTYVLPKNGVYAGFMNYQGKKYIAMINVGKNPTFHKEHKMSVEAHILDFNEMIYDEIIQLEFKYFIRDEISFSSKEELMDQITNDISTIRNKIKTN